jgi:acyl-CoA hydrolase
MSADLVSGHSSAAFDWRLRFADRLTTPEEAIRLLRPGHRIFIGSGAAQPVALVDAMVGYGRHLADNEVVHILTLGPAPYATPECADRFRHNGFFIGSNTRAAVREGRADFTPVFLSEIPSLFRSGRAPVDAALVQVSPPNDEGLSSLGVSVDVVRAAVDTARIVIAEVNPRMPRTRGETQLDLWRCSALVPVEAPLLQRPPQEPDAASRAIGELVADWCQTARRSRWVSAMRLPPSCRLCAVTGTSGSTRRCSPMES